MRLSDAAVPLVISLSVLAFVAATALARRASMDGRAERLLTAFVIWTGIVELPTYWLAWADRLYPGRLALISIALSLGVLGLSFIGRSPREHAKMVLADVVSFLRLPIDALIELSRQRSFAFLGALTCLSMILWTAWIAYLGPPGGWDGLWYHDTMVGYAIQNHGFRWADIPADLWAVNNFPRSVETLALWFVVFGDRRMIDLPNSIMAVPLMLGMYVIARRYCRREMAYSVGCACAVVLMPGMFLQFRSSYVDLTLTAFYVAALHFATRPNLRLRDAWLAAGMLGMVLGGKAIALLWVPFIGVVLLCRVLMNHVRTRPGSTVIALVGGLALFTAIGSPSYIRNWKVQGSPVWPYGFESKLLHIHWPGQPRGIVADVPATGSVLSRVLAPPVSGHDFPDTRERGYGIAFPLVIAPLALLGAVSAILAALRGFVREHPERRLAYNALYTTVPGVATIPLSVDLVMARYNVPLLVVLPLLTAWLLRRPQWVRIREGVNAFVAITGLLLFYWAYPGWGVTWSNAWDLAKMSPRERAGAHVLEFLPEPKVVAAREAELGPGDICAWVEPVLFPALTWNESYSNRSIWIPSSLGPEKTIQRAEEIDAKWFVANSYSPECSTLRSRPAQWQEVGQLSTTSPAMIAFRHVRAR